MMTTVYAQFAVDERTVGSERSGHDASAAIDISSTHLKQFAANMIRFGVPLTSVHALLVKFAQFLRLTKDDVDVRLYCICA